MDDDGDVATQRVAAQIRFGATFARMTTRIDRLQPGEGDRWRRIRLRALTEDPSAFSTTQSDVSRWTAARWEAQVVELATFVAVVDGEDVGVARGAVHPRGDVRQLFSMWVASSARRQGIGAQLIESVTAWAQADGATSLVLALYADNAAALALYERNGFRRVDDDSFGERPAGELRLERSLAASGE
jgi:GNAT superfamily N-acetyltransferase